MSRFDLPLQFHDPLLDGGPAARDVVRLAMCWAMDRPEGDEICPSCTRRLRDPVPAVLCAACVQRARSYLQAQRLHPYERQARDAARLSALFGPTREGT